MKELDSRWTKYKDWYKVRYDAAGRKQIDILPAAPEEMIESYERYIDALTGRNEFIKANVTREEYDLFSEKKKQIISEARKHGDERNIETIFCETLLNESSVWMNRKREESYD